MTETNFPSSSDHAMLREIYEQPAAITATIERHLSSGKVFSGELYSVDLALRAFKKLIIAASGSSRHAGLAGEIMIEDLSGSSVDVEYSSEYCYRSTHTDADPVVIVITQSGETADTIAAQRVAISRGAKTLAICNVQDSTIAREAAATLLTYAGVEAAVPATKSFTSQLALLYLFALFLAERRGKLSTDQVQSHLQPLLDLPDVIASMLPSWDILGSQIAARYHQAKSFLFLGRGVHYSIAREGALKLKEVSYAHAEAYPTGEVRHGPEAIISEGMPVVALGTYDPADSDSQLRYSKTLQTLLNLKANGARILVIANEGDTDVTSVASDVIYVPKFSELLLPLIEVVPLQLFAYHVARLNGTNIDQPRYLSKAVVSE